MSGYIDIVCNLYDPTAVRRGETGIDEAFKRQVRMDRRLWGGLPVSQYLRRMDRAGIERSLLIAVRAGDLRVRGSFELPYERVAKVCDKYPDRFSGLAGVDPYRGMQGLRDLEHAVKSLGFVGAHLYPHWFELAPDWVCEVLSPSTERIDRQRKLRIYAAASVGHAWLVNPAERTLEVLRLRDGAWTILAVHAGDELVRAEPFEALELDLARLWPEPAAQP